MNWVILLTSLIKLVLELVRWLERRQSIRAAEAAQLEALLERANVIASAAQLARSTTTSTDTELLSDPHNRANQRSGVENADRSGDPDSSL